MKINGIEIKLTEDLSWQWCLRQWDFVEDFVKKGLGDVGAAKKAFLSKHHITEVTYDCFFCEYDLYHEGDCTSCPGVIKSKHNIYTDILWCKQKGKNFFKNPLEFHKYLKELNEERLSDSGQV